MQSRYSIAALQWLHNRAMTSDLSSPSSHMGRRLATNSVRELKHRTANPAGLLNLTTNSSRCHSSSSQVQEQGGFSRPWTQAPPPVPQQDIFCVRRERLWGKRKTAVDTLSQGLPWYWLNTLHWSHMKKEYHLGIRVAPGLSIGYSKTSTANNLVHCFNQEGEKCWAGNGVATAWITALTS